MQAVRVAESSEFSAERHPAGAVSAENRGCRILKNAEMDLRESTLSVKTSVFSGLTRALLLTSSLSVRELMSMNSEATLSEDVVIHSPHVRLARFRVPTRCRLIPILRERLLKGLAEFSVAQGTRETHFCMALEEALNNAFYHGNLEICSELKEDDSSRFISLANERETLPPWSDRCVHVTELVSPFGLWLTIQDEGRGFDVSAAIRRSTDPETMLCSGRGLLLMRGFTDELFFNTDGNEVTLVLYGESQSRELPLGTKDSSDHDIRCVIA